MAFDLLVGLGNPGHEYENTRHNAGFWWIDGLSHLLNAPWRAERSYHGWVAKTQWNQKPLWLLKPDTFMNRSGLSVAALSRFFKIAPERILVAHDELDLPAGDIRLKYQGGHAGHNGLRDIHAQLACSDYWRLRIGIGHPGLKTQVSSWVLNAPSPDDRKAITQALERAWQAHSQLLDGDITLATQMIHSLPKRPSK